MIETYGPVLIPRAGVQFGVDQVALLRVEPTASPEVVVLHEWAFAQAVGVYAHCAVCEGDCPARHEPVREWLAGFGGVSSLAHLLIGQHRDLVESAPGRIGGWPESQRLVYLYHAVLVVFERRGPGEPLAEVLGEVYPMLLGGFAGGWPVAPEMGLEFTEPGDGWPHAARGFG